MLRKLGLVGLTLAMGCSGGGLASNNDNPDLAMAAAPSDLAPAPPDLELPRRDPTDHPASWDVPNNGGPVLPNAEIYTIVWPGDEALGAQVDQFHSWMLGSTYWTGSLGEYGVGAGTAKGVIVLPTAAPKTIDDSAFGTLIKQSIASGLFPAPDKNTLFAFIVPKNTTSTLQGTTGCQEYGGYHAETQTASHSGVFVPYSVNLQCAGFAAGSAFDGLTDVLSHEAAEAATDPHPYTRPGWVSYEVPLGGEIGDLCVGLEVSESAAIDVPDAGTDNLNYLVTRLYSAKAAADGTTDPCVPAPNHPYFNVAINPPAITVNVDSTGKGTLLVKVEPFAYGSVGTIKWALEGQPGPGVTVKPTSGQGTAGDTTYMQIDVNGAQAGYPYPLSLYTQSANGGTNQWFSSITVMQQ